MNTNNDRDSMTELCADCGEVITFVDGYWVDRTIWHPIVTASFAAMCETGGTHRPTTTENAP